MKLRRIFPLILVLCLLLPLAVSAEETAPAPRIEANHTVSALPDRWNPLSTLSEEAALLLRLTAAPLYSLSPDGKDLTPVLAESLPQDVTAEFAGRYGIPADAARGYAFRIGLDPEARWEDGSPVTSRDFVFTFRQLIENKAFPLELAMVQEYYSGAQKGTGDIVSLRDAGFGSVEEAENAGYNLFYVDTGRFWGLDAGWVSVGDYTRLKDSAIPSGVTEMYVSGAYLYDRYLRTGCETDRFQRQFIGICSGTERVTREDIGLIEEEGSLVLILRRPAAAEYVALQLSTLLPVRESIYADNYATSAKSYRSCGPYRILSATEEAILLEPNPYWTGKTQVFRADLIRLEIGA